MRKLFKALGLGEWQSLQWKYRVQGSCITLVILAILTLFVVLLGGCSARTSISGGEIKLEQSSTTTPAVTTVTNTKRTEVAPDGKPLAVVESVTTTQQAPTQNVVAKGEAKGAAAEAVGAELKQEVNNTAPALNLAPLPGGTTGSSGEAGTNNSTIAAISAGKTSPLIFAGIALLLGAGACFYFGLRSAAIACAATGGVLLLVGIYPGVLLWAFVASSVVLAAWLVYQNRKGVKTTEALKAVVSGVELAPEEAAKIIKAEIGKQATPEDRAVIRTIKTQDGL